MSTSVSPTNQLYSGTNLSYIDLEEQNHLLANNIRRELSAGFPKIFGNVKSIPLPPSEYFNDSAFWDHSPEGAKSCWAYCLSRFRSKEEVIPNIFIGTVKYALLNELCQNDYTRKENDDFTEKDPSMVLTFKNNETEKAWFQIKEVELGSLEEKIPFSCVISVVKNSEDESLLRKNLGNPETTCGYSSVKIHKYVQLRDLPSNEGERQEQVRQWEVLQGKFGEIFDLLDKARENKTNVLLHCVAGRHRSAALIAAYLAVRLKLTPEEALNWVHFKRRCSVPFGRSEFSTWLPTCENP